jgi:hypothetical protein
MASNHRIIGEQRIENNLEGNFASILIYFLEELKKTAKDLNQNIRCRSRGRGPNRTPPKDQNIIAILLDGSAQYITRRIFVFVIYLMICSFHCHHGMARPQVADGGDGLQICRVAASILNKQSRTANKG